MSDKPIEQILVEQLSQALFTIADESVRLKVVESIINITLDGHFCDDKRQLTALPDVMKPDLLRLINLSDLPNILEMRNSVRH